MRRLHLFELEDLAWFPETIRDLATDYLRFVQTRFALHKPIVPLLRDVLSQSGTAHVVDLCSGGGGPVLGVYEALANDGMRVTFTLTDRFPHITAFRDLTALHPSGILYSTDPVDATQVPAKLLGLRTMFNAFHHFAPAEAHSVLKSAVEAEQPIAIFEIPERTLSTLIPIFFTPLFVAVVTPFIRPFQWRRLFWTYLLPMVPLICWWDGLVSQCRAYTVAELMELTTGLDGYDWHAAKVPIGATPGNLTYLCGMPKKEDR